ARARERAPFFGQEGRVVAGIDASYRSWFSSSATFSRYLVVDGYSLVNARVGFQTTNGWAATLGLRTLLDKNYFELLTAAPGNTGLFVGQPGDPRTFGLSVRGALRAREERPVWAPFPGSFVVLCA